MSLLGMDIYVIYYQEVSGLDFLKLISDSINIKSLIFMLFYL